jgi:polyphenol oxidase
MTPAWLEPDWPAPPGVRAATTLRTGGVSPPPWHALNLGDHVGDDPARVAQNRRLLGEALGLPEAPAWLAQVHGREVLRLEGATLPAERVADGAVTGRPGRVLAVLTADCLPVLFCSADGRRIGVAHAGWRGLADGVLEATLPRWACPRRAVLAWIGPGIGAAAYEVGAEVRDACLAAGRMRRRASPRGGPGAGSSTSPGWRGGASRRSASRRSMAGSGALTPSRRASTRTGATAPPGRPGGWRRCSGSTPVRGLVRGPGRRLRVRGRTMAGFPSLRNLYALGEPRHVPAAAPQPAEAPRALPMATRQRGREAPRRCQWRRGSGGGTSQVRRAHKDF